MKINQIESFILNMEHRLSGSLPGQDAQVKMEPITRKKYLLHKMHDTEPKQSAVLILIFHQEDDLHIYLMKRNEYDGVHSGQISFPGGSYEKHDNDLFYTALRETEEEIGIKIKDIQVLGNLTPLYIPPSNFNVFPVVGFLNSKPSLNIDNNEVDEIFSVSFSELLSNQNIGTGMVVTRDGNEIEVPCYWFKGHKVWGATSMILSEFIEAVNQTLYDSFIQ